MLENLLQRLALKVVEAEDLMARVKALKENQVKEEARFEELSILLHKKYGEKLFTTQKDTPEAQGILPPSTSDDEVKKLALDFENLAPPSHPGNSLFPFTLKKSDLRAALLEAEKVLEKLKTDNTELQELCTTKEREAEKLLFEKQELKARVEGLSNSLKDKLKEEQQTFISLKNLESDNMFLKDTIALKEKELDSILLEKQDLKEKVDLLSKSLAEMEAAKEKELDTFLLEKEELKETVVLQSKSLVKMENALNLYLADKENQKAEGTILSQNEELKARVEVLSKLLQDTYNKLKKGKEFFIANQDKEEKVSGTKTSSSVESMSSTKKISQEAHPLHKFLKLNVPPPEGEEFFIANQDKEEKVSGTKTSSSVESMSSTKKICQEAHPLHKFPKLNVPPPEGVEFFIANQDKEEKVSDTKTSSSVESMSSTKKICQEAHLLNKFPKLNVPPPDSPEIVSKKPILCEECNKEHVPYFYCFNQPCSACYSKDHHFINCRYLRFIPKGAEYNRAIYVVECSCGGNNLFNEDTWTCSYCGSGFRSILKDKCCTICGSIGDHSGWECPKDKDKAASLSSYRDSLFGLKDRKAESLAVAKPSQSEYFVLC